MAIVLKSRDEISVMREAGRVVGEVLQILAEAAKPGVRERELDEIVREEYKRRKVIPTFLGYGHPAYPATVCVSVNDKIVHGIPGDYVFQEGDIVSIDLGATHRGFVGDSALTIGVGTITPEAQMLIDVTRESLYRGIAAAKPGVRVGAISWAVQSYVESEGYSVVREYVGHGVGREMHEDPQVPNFGSPEQGVVLRSGMVIAIEPMVNIGDWRTKRDKDNWTVRTADGSLSAHFEHTIAITDDEAEILTLP
jgi:methionyl aminopeptidase